MARAMGCTVQHLHTVGRGCPDVLVGVNGENHLWEIKDGRLPPSKRKLTIEEEAWHETWRGSVAVIETIEQAEEFINRLRKAGL